MFKAKKAFYLNRKLVNEGDLIELTGYQAMRYQRGGLVEKYVPPKKKKAAKKKAAPKTETASVKPPEKAVKPEPEPKEVKGEKSED